MKKVLLLVLLTLTACIDLPPPQPSKTIINPQCERVQIKVFQVLDDFALADACPQRSLTRFNKPYYADPEEDYEFNCNKSYIVYLPKGEEDHYYDHQTLKFPDGKCPIYTNTFTYYNKLGIKKTVPKVKFINKTITNPAYTEWLKQYRTPTTN